MEKLISISNLCKNSFTIYKQNFGIFIKLTLINSLAFIIFSALGIAFFLLHHTVFFFLIEMIIIFAIAMMTFWTQVSIIFVIKEKNNIVSVRQILQTAWPYLGPFGWVSILVGLAIFGGLLFFIIPGIIFAVWFIFAKYVLIFEDEKGMSALKISQQLVSGNWWPIFGRLVIVGILTAVTSYIPFFGSFINMLFILPFVTIYTYLIYQDLKRIQHTSIELISS